MQPALVPHGRAVGPEVAEARRRELEVVRLGDPQQHAADVTQAPSRTSASSGRAARISIAWLQPSGTTHAGLAVARDLLGEEAERRLPGERVLERRAVPGVVTRLALGEPEPERRDEPRVAARVVVVLVPEDAAVVEPELALDRLDRRAHARRRRVDRAKRPGEAEQRAVDARVLAVDAAHGLRRVAQRPIERGGRRLAELVRAPDPARAQVAPVLVAPEVLSIAARTRSAAAR